MSKFRTNGIDRLNSQVLALAARMDKVGIMEESVDFTDEQFETAEECGEVRDNDIIDEAHEQQLNLLIEAGYEEDVAEEAMIDALDALFDTGIISEPPHIEEDDETKRAWVADFIPKLHNQFKAMGLEF